MTDLILSEDRLSIGPLFVESWNVYTLKADRLGPVFDLVKSDILDAVKRLQKDPSAYPEWASHPRPIIAHDPRVYFRELEVETGYTFSAAAVEEIVSEMESGTNGSEQESVGELKSRISNIVDGVQWRRDPESFQDVLVLARLPEARFKLAASVSEIRQAYANLAIFSDEKLKDFRPALMEIYKEEKDEEGLYTVDGRVSGLPEGIRESEIYCYLEIPGGELVPPSYVKLDHKTGSFIARFQPVALRGMNLLTAVRVSVREG